MEMYWIVRVMLRGRQVAGARRNVGDMSLTFWCALGGVCPRKPGKGVIPQEEIFLTSVHRPLLLRLP